MIATMVKLAAVLAAMLAGTAARAVCKFPDFGAPEHTALPAELAYQAGGTAPGSLRWFRPQADGDRCAPMYLLVDGNFDDVREAPLVDEIDGTFSWRIPEGIAVGTDLQIRQTCGSNDFSYDVVDVLDANEVPGPPLLGELASEVVTLEGGPCDDVRDLVELPKPVYAQSAALISAPAAGQELLLKGWRASSGTSVDPERDPPNFSKFASVPLVDGGLGLRVLESGFFAFQLVEASTGLASETRSIEIDVPETTEVGCTCKAAGYGGIPAYLVGLALLSLRPRRSSRPSIGHATHS